MRCLICLNRYDTVVNNIWYGAALIISKYCCGSSHIILPTPYIAADASSTYSPAPLLTYEWDPDKQSSSNIIQPERTASGASFDLGPHPADPRTTATIDAHYEHVGPNFCRKEVGGEEIYVYVDGHTFVSFTLHITVLQRKSQVVHVLEILLGDTTEW
jgi:hypothetical protein